jgi:hypothetical protein
MAGRSATVAADAAPRVTVTQNVTAGRNALVAGRDFKHIRR